MQVYYLRVANWRAALLIATIFHSRKGTLANPDEKGFKPLAARRRHTSRRPKRHRYRRGGEENDQSGVMGSAVACAVIAQTATSGGRKMRR